MAIVIYNEKTELMSTHDYNTLTARIDEINQIIDTCDPSCDGDILENLDLELAEIDRKIEESWNELLNKETKPMQKKSNLYAGPGMNTNLLETVERIFDNLYASGYDKKALNASINWKLKEINQKNKRKVG